MHDDFRIGYALRYANHEKICIDTIKKICENTETHTYH